MELIIWVFYMSAQIIITAIIFHLVKRMLNKKFSKEFSFRKLEEELEVKNVVAAEAATA